DDLLALAVRRAGAARVEQPGVERRSPAEAAGLATRQRGVAVVERCHAGDGLALDVQLGLLRRLADPVLLEQPLVARVLQGVGVLGSGLVPPRAVELVLQLAGQVLWPREGGAVVLGV